MNFNCKIAQRWLEYYDEDHVYLVDGVIVPSITQLLKRKFGNKYDGISATTLERAAERGTQVHEAIENYVRNGVVSDLPEARNFRFLEKQYGFKCVDTEHPVILFHEDKPIAAGRFDLELAMNGAIGGADIKRTSTLDKEYLAYQLNLYRIAYWQDTGREWKFLYGIHLRDDVRKFVPIPIREKETLEFIKWYMEVKDE